MDAVTLSDEGCRFCGESSLSSHNVGSACLRTPSCTQAHSDVPPYSPTAAQGSRNRRPGQCCFLNFGGRIATAGLFTNVVRDNSQIVCGTCYSHGDKTLKELKERRQEALAKPPAGATRGAAQRDELVLLDLNVLAGAPARGGGGSKRRQTGTAGGDVEEEGEGSKRQRGAVTAALTNPGNTVVAGGDGEIDMDAESVGGSGGGNEGETGNSAGSGGAGPGGVGGDDVEHGGRGAGVGVTHGAPFVVGARAQVPPPPPQLPNRRKLGARTTSSTRSPCSWRGVVGSSPLLRLPARHFTTWSGSYKYGKTRTLPSPFR